MNILRFSEKRFLESGPDARGVGGTGPRKIQQEATFDDPVPGMAIQLQKLTVLIRSAGVPGPDVRGMGGSDTHETQTMAKFAGLVPESST